MPCPKSMARPAVCTAGLRPAFLNLVLNSRLQMQKSKAPAGGRRYEKRSCVNIAMNGAIEPSSLAGHGMPCPY